MAKNFTINARHYNGSISLDLNGDFDAISAFELLNFIKDQCLNCSQVFVNTEGLKKIFEAKERVKRAEKRAKMVEAETLRDFHQRTKISPSLVYIIDQVRGIVEGIISVVRKEEEEKERKEEK